MRKLLLFLFLGIVIIFAYLGFNILTHEDAVTIYFYRYDKLYPVKRSAQPDMQMKTAVFALSALFEGPNTEERSNRIQTMIPSNIRCVVPSGEKNGVLVLVFNEALLNISGGHNVIEGMLKQVVFTVTEIQGINAVRFQVLNQENETLVIGGEGYTIDRPLDRAYFKGAN